MAKTNGGLILPPGYSMNASGLPMQSFAAQIRDQIRSMTGNDRVECVLAVYVPNKQAVDYAATGGFAVEGGSPDLIRLFYALAKKEQGKRPGGSRIIKPD